jgi:DNA mismatch repair protein MutS2
MEPSIVNELNNEVTKLLYEEHQEIEKILRELTAFVSQYHDVLYQNFDMITTLDMIFAKAKYGLINECNIPKITSHEINLRKARHPLIPNKEVVANTITFKENQKIIIITGPNTGGKTVALKTMGLLSIMVQSGMMIPIEEESTTIIFDNIFADIGDEQSIEQSLSTFSSHMTRITKIIKQITPNSLILLDELGSGTDPKEGSSLAMAILDFIREYKVFVIATTHYPELKVYAYDKEDIINASVEFDVDSLSPTYRLLLGTPGKSNALLICERLGLQREIIKRAKANVATSNTEVSDLINKLEHQGNELDLKIQEYEALVSEEKRLVKDNKELKSELKERKNQLREKAFIEKSQIVNEAKEQALRLLKDIEELQKEQEVKPHQFADLKHKIKSLDASEKRISQTKNHEYQIGDIVNVIKFNRNGELIKNIKKNIWEVKMGVLTSELKTSEFEFVESKKITKPKSKVRSNVKKQVKGELDLRGMRYEEAKIELDRYIDQCLVANMPYASVIHGYGTLALRKMVKEHLKHHPSIQSYRDGEGGEGGSGVTIIQFK